MPELKACLGGVNAIGDYLVENVAAYEEDHFAWSKAIWDIGAIGILVDPDWTQQKICASPVIASPDRYSFDPRRHLIRSVCTMDRDLISIPLISLIKIRKTVSHYPVQTPLSGNSGSNMVRDAGESENILEKRREQCVLPIIGYPTDIRTLR